MVKRALNRVGGAGFQKVKGFNPEKNALSNNAEKAFVNIQRETKDVIDPSVFKEFKGSMDKGGYANKPFSEVEQDIYNKVSDMEIARRELNWGNISNSNDVARRRKWAEKEYEKDYSTSLNHQRKTGAQKIAAEQAARNPVPAPQASVVSFDDMKPTREMSKTEAYQRNDQIRKFQSAEKMRVNGDMDQSLMKQYGLDEQGLQNYKGMNDTERMDFYKTHMDKRVSNPGIVDPMMAHKVPHIAGGALATAGLVSAMSSSRGQQSNAQLYGQQQPYY